MCLLVPFATVNATEMAVYPSKPPQDNTEKQSYSKTPSKVKRCGGANQKPCLYVISNKHVNRIVTPFENPSLKFDAIKGFKHKEKDNVVYVSTSGNDPIAGFITESGDESSSIKVVLNPQPTSPQEITLQSASSAGSAIARKFERSSPRTETIKKVLTTLAKGSLPQGYTMKNLDAAYFPDCKQTGLSFDFYNGQFVSGGDYVVSIGVITNHNHTPTEFKENTCNSDNVVAVSAYPSPKLLPNEKAEVYVMYYRNKPVTRSEKQRRSLIGGDNE
jgi:conjugal transfer pilus assembly protein TraK